MWVRDLAASVRTVEDRWSHICLAWLHLLSPEFYMQGVLHTVGGYMVYAATTFKYVFDYHPGDIFWYVLLCIASGSIFLPCSSFPRIKEGKFSWLESGFRKTSNVLKFCLNACCRCTADCGWITGHTYITYGPLLNGATIVVFEGVCIHHLRWETLFLRLSCTCIIIVA